MATSLFQDIPLKAKIIGWGIIFVPLAALVFAGAILLRPESIDQRLVWGCYVAHDAPPLDIREDAIYIVEPARRKFSYIAQPSKTSYELNVRPARALSPQPSRRYAFVDRRGDGYFWPLLPAEGKNRNRVRHPEEYAGRFEVYAADGARIIYERARASEACRSIG